MVIAIPAAVKSLNSERTIAGSIDKSFPGDIITAFLREQ